ALGADSNRTDIGHVTLQMNDGRGASPVYRVRHASRTSGERIGGERGDGPGMRSPWPFLAHPGPLAFAHRGGAGNWPENTMPAFEGAVSLRYLFVETDVHVTADGVLLAFHDDRLDRVTNRTGK